MVDITLLYENARANTLAGEGKRKIGTPGDATIIPTRTEVHAK